MREHLHSQYSSMADPPSGSATLVGTLGFVALLGGVLLAASYPVVVAAAVAGALAASLVRHVSARIRHFGMPSTRTGADTDASAPERDLSQHTQ
jgi:hypothetical protein